MASPDNQNLKNWLVKSSTRILGPFSRDEVVQLLTRRQITIIDEIRQPDIRWNYIRETRYFKEVVKNLRFEDDHSREDTMTSTATGTMTKTDNGAILIDDLTPPPHAIATPAAPAVSPMPGVRDVTPSAGAATALKSHGPARSYGNPQDQRVQTNMQKQNSILRAALGAVLVIALLFAVYTYLGKDRKNDMSYDQLIAAALKYKELGLYQKSLTFYRKAASIHEVDLETQFQMVFVLINEDRQSLKGRRVIERALLKENRSRQDIVSGHLGLSLSYMMEGDLKQAEEYLQKTLGLDSTNEAAKLNQAVIQLKNGHYATAIKSFENLSRGDAQGYPLILLGKSISLIELSKKQPEKERLRAGINEIKAYIGRSHFMRKELSLLLIYLQRLAVDPAGELDAISAFMDEPYELSKQYVKDLRVDWRNGDWDYLERYCNELYTENSPVAMKAVRAMCLLESNRDTEAAKLVDEVLAQAPKQMTSVQAQAELLKKQGRLNEANILMQGSEFKQTRLALYLQGETCIKSKDLACADNAYKILADKDFGDVLSHYGLAQVAQMQSEKARMQNEIKAGFEAEANYAPLIEFRDKVESP